MVRVSKGYSRQKYGGCKSFGRIFIIPQLVVTVDREGKTVFAILRKLEDIICRSKIPKS